MIRIPLGSAHLRTDELEDVEALITPHAVLVKPEKTDLEEVFEEGEGEEDEESKKTGKAKNRMRILIV